MFIFEVEKKLSNIFFFSCIISIRIKNNYLIFLIIINRFKDAKIIFHLHNCCLFFTTVIFIEEAKTNGIYLIASFLMMLLIEKIQPILNGFQRIIADDRRYHRENLADSREFSLFFRCFFSYFHPSPQKKTK